MSSNKKEVKSKKKITTDNESYNEEYVTDVESNEEESDNEKPSTDESNKNGLPYEELTELKEDGYETPDEDREIPTNIDNNQSDNNESEHFKSIIKKSFLAYLDSGSRSNKRTLILHGELKDMIQKQLPSEYKVEEEKNVKSINTSRQKKCDILAYKNKILYFIFPVKFIQTNYYQNKNNNWENLTGELLHLTKANENIRIIPINIIFSRVPYCKKSSCIAKFEDIKYDKSYKITEKLVEWKLASDIINYIIDVEHISKIGEKYDKCPKLLGFNKDTPYRTFKEILTPFL